MLICPKCNHQVPDDAKFCEFCGVRFLPTDEGEATAESQATTVLTSDMRNGIYSNNYSSQQGASQPQAQAQPQVHSQPQPQVQQNGFQPSQPNGGFSQPQAPSQGFAPSQNFAGAPAGQPGYGAPQPFVNQNAPYPQRPMLSQLRTDRSFIKTFLLSLITFGIYGLVAFGNISEDVNVVCSRYDGKKSMNYYLLVFIVGPLTFGIASIVWMHNICERIGTELNRRQVAYDFGAKDFWLWNVLGSLIIVGPFVFAHKFFTAVNKMNENYNLNG